MSPKIWKIASLSQHTIHLNLRYTLQASIAIYRPCSNIVMVSTTRLLGCKYIINCSATGFGRTNHKRGGRKYTWPIIYLTQNPNRKKSIFPNHPKITFLDDLGNEKFRPKKNQKISQKLCFKTFGGNAQFKILKIFKYSKT